MRKNRSPWIKKLRRQLRRKEVVVTLALIVVLGGTMGYVYRKPIIKAMKELLGISDGKRKKIVFTTKPFDDVQSVQIKAATANGIAPMDTEAGIAPLVQEAKLEMVETCNWYIIDRLTHSYPYLVPKAKVLLKDIGKGLQEATDIHSRMIVTSLLRTSATVASLSGGNQNATKNSCHLYGTTFDITYARFDSKYSVQTMHLALRQVLRRLQRSGRCYVKYEQRQCCYHITVR